MSQNPKGVIITGENAYKECPTCTVIKVFSDFGHDPFTFYGIRTRCKLCEIEKSKRYRDANADKVCAAAKYYRRLHDKSLAYKFSILRCAARVRSIPCTLTLEQYVKLVQDKTCHYCNSPLPVKGTGVDRKSCLDGYCLENCVPCCTACNSIKGTYISYEEMLVLSAVLKNMRSHNG